MSQVAHAINEQTITCVIGGEIYTIQRDHPEAHLIERALRDNASPTEVVRLFDKIKAMAAYMGGSTEVSIKGNKVYYNGTPIHGVVVDRILEFMSEGLPYKPLVNFLARLQANPSKRSTDQLYAFLEHKNLPLTPEGKILAYKAITCNWTDKHTGRINNSIGQIVSMNRNKVDDDPASACSTGLHCGSLEYVESFASGYGSERGDRIVIVEVDPKNVVSVPRDSSCQKMRVCEYTVVAEYTGPLPEHLVSDSSSPYDGYDSDYDEESELDDEYDPEDVASEAYVDGVADTIEQVEDTLDDIRSSVNL